MLATPADPFDPMEKAIRAFVRDHLRGTEHVHDGWAPEQAYELSPDILAMTQVFPAQGPQRHLLACKGAPEAVADLCHLDAGRPREPCNAKCRAWPSAGLRVLAVARGEWQGAQWPASQHDFTFRLLGLVGLADPPRPEVPAAVAACRRAGIRVIMMTGDHPATAHAIARQVGLSDRADVLTGAQLAAMDEAALVRRLRDVEICARLAPEQKLRLVRALQAGGERVGMTGDGVNDAPALKAAHVGIAMGERGTDVAREAAAIVLLDDSFASITQAIRQGRHIDDNIRTAVRFIFAIHMPVIALALVPTLMHWPLLLLPAQVVLFELIIDPACSVVFEAEPAAADLMERTPRPVGASPFEWANVVDGLVQGLGMAAILMVGLRGDRRAGMARRRRAHRVVPRTGGRRVPAGAGQPGELAQGRPAAHPQPLAGPAGAGRGRHARAGAGPAVDAPGHGVRAALGGHGRRGGADGGGHRRLARRATLVASRASGSPAPARVRAG